jgi:DNA-binding NarL/FixJ family response regulator
MLSMHAGRPYVLGSLKAGAAGYLSKESAPDELVEAVNTVLAGGTYVSESLAGALATPANR